MDMLVGGNAATWGYTIILQTHIKHIQYNIFNWQKKIECSTQGPWQTRTHANKHTWHSSSEQLENFDVSSRLLFPSLWEQSTVCILFAQQTNKNSSQQNTEMKETDTTTTSKILWNGWRNHQQKWRIVNVNENHRARRESEKKPWNFNNNNSGWTEQRQHESEKFFDGIKVIGK